MGGLSIVLRIAAIIFLVEGGIMFAFSRFGTPSTQISAAVDAVLLVVLSSPFIFALVIKPYVDAKTRDIRHAMEAAEKANRAKDEFLAHMSHELRTPLNAIIGFSQLLQHNPAEPLTHAQQEYTGSISSSGEHLLEIINGVLDLAAIEADQVKVALADIDASVVVGECIALMRPAAQTHQIKMVNHAAAFPRYVVRTDEMRLKQALINLLSNAVKYNKPGGRVVVDGLVMEDGNFRISVSDTGRGIRPEHFESIFEPFDRLGAESTRAIEGTGIGLTVTKKLVERIGARIGFESELGVGSTFWIEVPLVTPPGQLVWSDELGVGIEAIDADHKVLISLVNTLSERNFSRQGVDEVLGELLDYTDYHFKSEEAALAACGCAEFESHKDNHRLLTARVNALSEAWREHENPEIVHDLLAFLRTWLVKHIMEEDRVLARYAPGREREIAAALEAFKRNTGKP